MKEFKLIYIVVLSFLVFPCYGQDEQKSTIENYLESNNCEALNQMLTKESNNPDVIITYGRCLIQTDKVEEALSHFKNQRKLLNDHADFHYWYGQAYRAKLNSIKNFVEKGIWAAKTKTQFQKAVDLDPDHLAARNSLANYYLNAPAIAGGSKKKAKQQIEEIKKRDPKMGYSVMAQLYTSEKKYEEARQEYMNYLEISGDTVGVYYQIGFNYQTQELYPEAFDAFQVSIDAGHDRNNSYYQYARTAVFSNSRKEQAIKYLDHYIQYSTPDGPAITFAYWRKGLIYQLMGDEVAARENFEKALALDPGNQQAAKSLQEMK